jgi:hypothetical protein
MAHEPNAVSFFGAIEKFDAAADGSLMVSGIASTESVDADGEIVTADAMRKALPSYLQSGTVREMHQPIAAGCPISAHVDDDGRTHFTAKIVDVGTIAKIKSNVLKGFSIGGKSIAKVGNKITEILLRDISVVDIPNNPESVFSIIKFEKPEEKHKTDCDCADCKKTKTEKFMSDELIQKVDTLTATVEALAKTVETLSKVAPVAPPDLTKVLTDIGDLQKFAAGATQAVENAERTTVITKMQLEGRVAFNENGVAYKTDELQKMDLTLLKFAARNSQVIPLVARATYTGSGTPPEGFQFKDAAGKELGTDEILEKAWGTKYGDINKMIASTQN